MSEERSALMTDRTEDVAVVMDLGGTQMRVAVADWAGAILWREAEPTRAQESQAKVIARMEAILGRGIAQVGGRTLAGIGIGLAGPVDPATGIMYDPPNIRCLDGVSFKALWEKRFRWPVLVGNDATLAALGEYRYGAGAGAHTLVYMTVSTGIGGGVVVEGQPLMGAYGMAGELGHMCVDLNGPPCQCGGSGCLERIASGTAIAETARRRRGGDGLLRDGRPGLLASQAGLRPRRCSRRRPRVTWSPGRYWTMWPGPLDAAWSTCFTSSTRTSSSWEVGSPATGSSYGPEWRPTSRPTPWPTYESWASR